MSIALGYLVIVVEGFGQDESVSEEQTKKNSKRSRSHMSASNDFHRSFTHVLSQ